MPRGGHGGYGHGGRVSHGSYGLGRGYGRSAVSSSHHHHYSGARLSAAPVQVLLTPAQAAWREASALYAAYYSPRGCCCPGSLPYVGGFLTLLALVLTIASLATPWYYLGGTQLVLGSSGLHWGVAASLNSLTYCSFFLPLQSSNDAVYWFSRTSSCRASPVTLASLGLSAAPFHACLVLCALALPLHLLALLHPVLGCACCACGGGQPPAAGAEACASPCRPAPGPDLHAAHASVLALKAAPAALGLVGMLAALYGLPAAALHSALGSPSPGAQDAPGAVLARLAVAAAWAAVAAELGYCGAAAAHAARAGQRAGRPLPPPAAPPQPTELEARALAQGTAMVRSGLLSLLQPAPVLPEDRRAYGVWPLLESEAPAAEPQVELYYCRLRLYQGAALRADEVGGGGGGGAAAGGAKAEGGEEAVPLVLAWSTGGGEGTRVRVRLGEEGAALPVLSSSVQLAQLLQLAAGSGGRGQAPFGLPPSEPAAGAAAAAAAAPNFCTACGASLAAGARYCAQCGAGVAAAQAV